MGDVKSTVERIGLRSMQLWHHRGPLNTVPWGNIRRLVNESRDWVIEKLEFWVTYDTDIVKVRKILKRIGQEMLADPELAAGLLEPLKCQGITAADDSALVVRAKFMAKPTDLRYVIRRDAYSRVVKTKETYEAAWGGCRPRDGSRAGGQCYPTVPKTYSPAETRLPP